MKDNEDGQERGSSLIKRWDEILGIVGGEVAFKKCTVSILNQRKNKKKESRKDENETVIKVNKNCIKYKKSYYCRCINWWKYINEGFINNSS